MTDQWCFTCKHEIKQKFGGAWLHIDDDDEQDCICIRDEINCEP